MSMITNPVIPAVEDRIPGLFDLRGLSYSCLRIDGGALSRESETCVPQVIENGGLCLCLGGSCEISLNQQRYLLHEGDLCMFFPQMQVQLIGRSSDFAAYCIVSKLDAGHEMQFPASAALFLYIKDNPCISLGDEASGRMLVYCRQIEALGRLHHVHEEHIARHLLLALFYEVAAVYEAGKPMVMQAQSRQEMMFRGFIRMVGEHYGNEREIGFYANLLCVTPKYLSTVVKGVSGHSAAWWIAQTVTHHAKNLLATSRLTIQQISDELNFPNPSFFGQYFKRRTGMTPKEYRRKAR